MTRDLPSAASLTPQQLAALLEEMAAQARMGIPWADALGVEGGRWRGGRSMAEAFEPMAEQLRKGRGVEEVLAEIGGEYGPQVAAVVQAGAASGNPAEALSGLAGLIRRRIEYRRRLMAALVYPLLVSLFAFGLLVGGLMWVSRRGAVVGRPVAWLEYWWVVPAVLVAAFVVAILLRRRLSGWLPARLRAVRWASLAWFAELVALEVEQGMPMDQAVRLSAEASGDALMRRTAAEWSAAEERGGSLAPKRDVPRLLVWTLRYGKDSPAGLPAALRRLASIYWYRSEQASMLLTGVVPAVLLIGVAGSLAIAFVLLVLGPIYGTFH